MKRSLRKAVAFFMAVTMLAGSFNLSAFAAETDQTKSSSVTTLAETIYDEAVTFSDSVAFLQNGHWSDDGQTNVTADTTIVFMDAQGNKTELKNNDGNGNQLFDAIYPMISDGYHQFDAFKVIKDGKMSYIRADVNNPYYGTSLQWYYYAKPLSDDYLLVSDDKITYNVIDAAGKVILSDLTSFSYASEIGNCVYVQCGNALYVIYQGGQVRPYDRFADEHYYYYHNLGNGYAMVDAEEYTELLDANGNIVEAFQMIANDEGTGTIKVTGMNVDEIESGYIIRRVKNIESSGNTYYSDIYNLNTGEVVVKSKYNPEFDGDTYVAYHDDYTAFVGSVNGTTYIPNVETYVMENLVTDSYQEVTYSFYYVNDSLLISLRDLADGVEAETYVLTKETAFADGAKKHVDGIVDCISYDEEFVMTCDNDWYISTMIKINGDVVKVYEEGSYGYTSQLKKRYSDETRSFYEEIDGFAFRVSVRDSQNGGYSMGHSYITEDGEIHNVREIAQPTGNFIVDYSISGVGVKVINTDNKVVYENSDVEWGNVAAFWYRDYFTVTLEGRVYLYDRDGNLVLGDDAEYAAIGDDNIRGTYPAHDKDYYGTYDYYNECLENGLCIVKVKVGDTYKYGAVSIEGSSDLNGLQYNETDGNWYYYVDGKIATYYTGLVAHAGAWFYVENGMLNWNYTGLTLYGDIWFYVENGVLNWNYTGLTCYGGTWFYVENGVLNWNYTGLTLYGDTWFYVENGVLNWNYTGLTLYGGTWFYVENGVLNWNYTGLTCYGGTWFYVENGVLNWNYTGLTCYGGAWFYVENGMLNWNYTGLVLYNGTWFYVGNGVLDWGYTGTVLYNGIWWYVENGVLVGPA